MLFSKISIFLGLALTASCADWVRYPSPAPLLLVNGYSTIMTVLTEALLRQDALRVMVMEPHLKDTVWDMLQMVKNWGVGRRAVRYVEKTYYKKFSEL